MSTTFKPNQHITNTLHATCIKCSHDTKHTIQANYLEHYEDNSYGFEAIHDYQIIQCNGCDTISFREIYSNSEDREPVWDNTGNLIDMEPSEVVKLFPPRLAKRKPLDHTELLHIPKNIRAIYLETNDSINLESKLLSAIGLRAITETICKHQIKSYETKTGNKITIGKSNKPLMDTPLFSKINWLVQEGLLLEVSKGILQGIRSMGNESVHDIGEQRIDQLQLALDVLENLLRTLYVFPARHNPE